MREKKPIVVTEENFEYILKKIKKMTDKYEMFIRHKHFIVLNRHKKDIYHNPTHIVELFGPNSHPGIFIYATKHWIRERYEDDKSEASSLMYRNSLPLIHLEMFPNAVCIRVGDTIKFYNNRFIVYTYDTGYRRLHGKKGIDVFEYTFTCDRSNPIYNLEEVIADNYAK